jgi:PAS domain S-box-containing protein
VASTFQTLADFLPEPMALVSASGIIRAVNQAFATLVESDTSVPGRPLGEMGWSTSDGWPDYLRRCARTRSLLIGAATYHRMDGSAVPYRCEGALYEAGTAGAEAVVLLRFLPKESSSSRFVALTQRIAELSSEIARRQRAEREARDQRELLHVTLASIGDAVIATDREGRVTFMNEVAGQLTGWRAPDAMQVHVSEVFRVIDEDTREPVENPVGKVLVSRRIIGLANHTLLVARDGTERPIDDSGAPIVDSTGQIHGVVLVFRDVTELRSAQRQEQGARAAAEAASRAKDEFLATLSHELRTPLNAILGWSRMLRLGILDESRRSHALDVIERNADMQARLIEDLLDVSRIMVGQLRLHLEPVDLPGVIAAAIDAVRPAAENKRLRVSSSIHVASPVYGDAARLQQVIWNLLANAVKFTPSGGAVSVDASEDGGAVRIVVTDSGEGIPPGFRPRLFDAFSQADASFSRPHGGLGLGLTIVRRLVEAHGGEVRAESGGANQGATFIVTLPLGQRRLPQAPPRPVPAPGAVRGCRVLVVEEDPDAAELTKTLLEAAGADAVICARAREALDAVERGGFEVLVADIGLPREEGFWLIRQVRSLPHSMHRTIPAVALTAFASARDRQSALAAGYDEHMPKPVDVDALLRSIERLRGRSRSDAPDG